MNIYFDLSHWSILKHSYLSIYGKKLIQIFLHIAFGCEFTYPRFHPIISCCYCLSEIASRIVTFYHISLSSRDIVIIYLFVNYSPTLPVLQGYCHQPNSLFIVVLLLRLQILCVHTTSFWEASMPWNSQRKLVEMHNLWSRRSAEIIHLTD